MLAFHSRSNLARGKDMITTDFYTGLYQTAIGVFNWPNQTAMNWTATAPWTPSQPGAPSDTCVAAMEADNYTWSAVPCSQTVGSLFCELGEISKYQNAE